MSTRASFTDHFGSYQRLPRRQGRVLLTKTRSVLLLFIATLLAAATTVAVSTEADASLSWRQIHSRASGKCLDNALENVSKVQIWTCVNGDPAFEGWEQMWQLLPGGGPYQLKNRHSGHCLGELFDTINVTSCGAGGLDQWDVIYENNSTSGWYQVLRNKTFGLCLTATGATNGAATQPMPCDLSFTSPSQQWLLGENLPFPGGATVPNVIGFSQTNAVNTIAAAGLTVDAPSHINDCVNPGEVEVQRPQAGNVMSPGLVVHLTIGTCTGGDGGIPK